MTLDEHDVAVLADALTQRLAPLLHHGDDLVDAAGAATFLDVDREWVYQHAELLGAIRLGDGPRARLRFHKPTMLRRLQECPVTEPSKPRPAADPKTDLLPIKGSSGVGSVRKIKRPGGAGTPRARHGEESSMQTERTPRTDRAA